jgi:hypothetical protein
LKEKQMITFLTVAHYSSNQMDLEDDGCLLVYCDEFKNSSAMEVRLENCDIEGAPSHPGIYRVKRKGQGGYWVLEPQDAAIA